MKTKKLLFYLLSALLGGCIPVMSLHPIYTEKDVVFETKLLGTWVDDPNKPETNWQFRRIDEPNNAYSLLLFENEDEKGLFIGRLVKLQDKLFLDLSPDKLPFESDDPNEVKWPFNAMFLIPAHTFIKIESTEPKLKMRLTDNDKMSELLKEDPNAVEYTSIEDRLILTASTKELQAFVLKYADNEKVFTDEIVLSRKQIQAPNTPNAEEPKLAMKGRWAAYKKR